jgi:hypothetical protein
MSRYALMCVDWVISWVRLSFGKKGKNFSISLKAYERLCAKEWVGKFLRIYR